MLRGLRLLGPCLRSKDLDRERSEIAENDECQIADALGTR